MQAQVTRSTIAWAWFKLRKGERVAARPVRSVPDPEDIMRR
jgi:hypothetical protein